MKIIELFIGCFELLSVLSLESSEYGSTGVGVSTIFIGVSLKAIILKKRSTLDITNKIPVIANISMIPLLEVPTKTNTAILQPSSIKNQHTPHPAIRIIHFLTYLC